MVIADYIDASGAEYCRLFDSFEDFHRVTFSPACRIWDIAEFKIHGATYRERKEAWDQNPEWPARDVEISFCLFDARITLKPEDLGLPKGPEDEGFMESIQKELEKDLAEAGATEIESSGFLD